MPVLNSVAKLAARPFPKAITPKAHAIIDYATAGSFFLSAGLFWRHHKRAAIAALIAGGAELVVNLLTDYPGGVKRIINFRNHRDIDFGLAAMAATMPEFLGFSDDRQRALFLAKGAMITGVAQLTAVPEERKRRSFLRAA